MTDCPNTCSQLCPRQSAFGMATDTSRPDGRTASQIRRLHCETGVLSRADGSARWTQENSSVLVAVYGPLQTTMSKESAEQANVEVIFKPRAGLTGTVDRQYESIIRQTVQGVIVAALHPRTLIQIVLQVVSDDGSLLSCALNAVCSALIDAGVPMKQLFAAVTVALSAERQLLMDPTLQEERAEQAAGCFAFPFSSAADMDPGSSSGSGGGGGPPGVLTVYTKGRMSSDDLQDMLEASWRGSQRLNAFLRQSVGKAFAPLAQ